MTTTRSPAGVSRIPSLGGLRLTPATARLYFGVQALAGILWWVAVFTVDAVRHATLGELPAPAVAAFDIPLFVVASALSACGVRWAVWVVAPWTALVAVGMVLYATATGLAGWGALMMALAALAGAGAGLVVLCGRAPVEGIASGPFAFRPAAASGRGRILARTGLQTLFFWGLFLVVLPLVIATVEARWALRLDFPLPLRLAGIVLLVGATALGVWSAVTMSVTGRGTPLPSQMPRQLVIAGPYRFVRNPMAIAGIAQGMAVGLLLSSWLVVAYALCGSLFWNAVVRPLEEDDLSARFGPEFDDYCARVACWLPIRRAGSPAP